MIALRRYTVDTNLYVDALRTERGKAAIGAPFERRGRIVTPSDAAWKDAASVLAELIRPDDWRSVPRSFVNDALLAMSCRESGVVLVTRNVDDFARIAEVRAFDFVPPWPGAEPFPNGRWAAMSVCE